MTLIEFILSITASIISTLLILLYSKNMPAFVRKMFFYILYKNYNSGIAFIYDNEDQAADDIINFAKKSKFIKILGIRGFRIASPDRKLNQLLSPELSYESLKIVLANPKSPYVSSRSIDFIRQDFLHVVNTYEHDITHVLDVISMYSTTNSRLVLRTHNQPDSFRLIIVDEYLYLSFYPKGKSASLSRCYKVHKDCELYSAFSIHFDWVYNNSQEYNSTLLNTKKDN